MSDAAIEAMRPYLAGDFFNPSAPYAPAVAVRAAYEKARADLAHAVGGKPAEAVVTAGATESISLAFASTDGHVVTTSIEHAAVLEAAHGLGRSCAVVPVDSNGRVTPKDIAAAITPETSLVSVGLANNEIGTVQPMRAISEVVKAERARRLSEGRTAPIHLHCDASQGAGLVDTNVSTLGVDLLTCNAAKVYGPKQVGMLWASSEVALRPIMVGGGQERGLRGGTENVAGAVGFACALTEAVAGRKAEAARLKTLRDGLEKALKAEFPQAVLSGHRRHRLPSFCHISFPGLDAERLVFMLEDKGVLVGTGAACAANKGTGSHVLRAIGLPEDVAQGSLRLSLGRLSTPENTARASALIAEAVRSEYARVRR